MIADLINPYLLYIKIAAIALVLAVLIGSVLYVKSVFAERQELLVAKAKVEAQLVTEQQKVVVAMEQLKIWQDTVAKMNQAIKSIKIQSDTYIQGVENEKVPSGPPGAVIPFILPASASGPAVPGFKNQSTGRIRSTAPKG